MSLEKEENQLRLDLEVEKGNAAHAQVEVQTMRGKFQQPSVLFSLKTIVQQRLTNCISLEPMQQSLVDKDNDLVGAQKVAREKTKAAKEKLAAIKKLEENKSLKTVAEEAKKEIAELKKRQAEWDDKFKTQASAFEQEKKTLNEKIAYPKKGLSGEVHTGFYRGDARQARRYFIPSG